MRLFFWWVNWRMMHSTSNSVLVDVHQDQSRHALRCHCRAEIVLETQHCDLPWLSIQTSPSVVWQQSTCWGIGRGWFFQSSSVSGFSATFTISHIAFQWSTSLCNSLRFPGYVVVEHLVQLDYSFWCHMNQLFRCDIGQLSYETILSH